MLIHVPRGDDLVVVASAGGSDTTPNWYKNLLAAGGAEVQVGADRWTVAARELERRPRARRVLVARRRRVPRVRLLPTASPNAGSPSQSSSAEQLDP